MTLLLEELKARIVATYDPDDLIDLLGVTTEQLVDSLEDFILANADKFTDLYDEDSPPWDDNN